RGAAVRPARQRPRGRHDAVQRGGGGRRHAAGSARGRRAVLPPQRHRTRGGAVLRPYARPGLPRPCHRLVVLRHSRLPPAGGVQMAIQGLDELIAAARQEPTLVGVGLTDPQSMRSIIWPAFQREAAPWAELEYTQDVVPPRVLARLKEPVAGAKRPDVLIVGNPASFGRAGVTEPFDQPAAGLYPAGWTDAQRYWIPVYVQPVVLIYNRYHAAPPPARWTDLADARWAGRVVFEQPWRMISTGPALAELHSALGAAGASELLAQ